MVVVMVMVMVMVILAKLRLQGFFWLCDVSAHHQKNETGRLWSLTLILACQPKLTI